MSKLHLTYHQQERDLMTKKRWITTVGVGMTLGLLAAAASASAQAREFTRGTTTVEVGEAILTVENNVKFVGYTVGEVLTVTLNFSSTCPIVFSGLALRAPQPFTPPKSVVGSLGTVTGTPSGTADLVGAVTFELTFTDLKDTGPKKAETPKKSFGVSHLDLTLGVDSDCDPATGDALGIDESVTIGVQVSVSTATHP
jgi:hypothetical protein